jgi:hypothetical protein
MDVTVHIPEELARRLTAAGYDLSRRALEALALEEYRGGGLTTAELGRVLGFGTDAALDDFLKAHGDARTDRDQARQGAAREAAQAIRAMSQGVRLGGLKIKDLISEGRL